MTSRPSPSEVAALVRIKASPCSDTPFLLRAREGLSERELPAAKWTNRGNKAAITFGEQHLTLRLAGRESQKQWLEIDGKKRPLGRDYGDWMGEELKLLWAGDLDGDGAIDFVIRVDGDGGDAIELYLSGGGLHRAAWTFVGGC